MAYEYLVNSTKNSLNANKALKEIKDTAGFNAH